MLLVALGLYVKLKALQTPSRPTAAEPPVIAIQKFLERLPLNVYIFAGAMTDRTKARIQIHATTRASNPSIIRVA